VIVMRKLRAVVVAALASLVLSAHTAPPPGSTGYYWLGQIWCTDRASCMHEVAHKLDDEAGWISGTPGYIAMLELYMAVGTHAAPEPFYVFTMFFLRDDLGPDPELLREIYATMFEQADGRSDRMPEIFRPFYDWTRADVLIEEYVR
jgi:hypothetical protein